MKCKKCGLETTNPKFCSRSCAVSFNNRGIKRNQTLRREKKISYCECGSEKSSRAKTCLECRLKGKKASILQKTKGDLFRERKNWQSARSSIQKQARKFLLETNIPKECKVCSYNIHVDVCHIKSVSDFEDGVLIEEINSIDNLIYLCPNHHWEFDRGLITLRDTISR